MPDGPGGKADGAKSQGDAGKAPPSRKKENVDAVEGFGDDGNLQKLLNQPPQEFDLDNYVDSSTNYSRCGMIFSPENMIGKMMVD